MALVKGFYDRPLHGGPEGGGRVTELMARPLDRGPLPPPVRGSPAPGRGDRGAPLGPREAGAGRRLRRGAGAPRRRGRAVRHALGGPGRPRGPDPPQPTPRRAAGQAVEVLRAGLERAGARGAGTGLGRGSRRPLASRWWPASSSPPTGARSRFGSTATAARRPPPGGGLAGTSHPLLAGTGATWVSASMGEADRLAHAEGCWSSDGLRARDPRRRRETYRWPTTWSPTPPCGSATTTSSTCPAGPASTGAGARRGTPTAGSTSVAEAVAAKADEGAPVLVQDYHLSLAAGRCWPRPAPTCARSTSATPPSPTPTCCAACPAGGRRAPGRPGRLRGLRVPHRPLGGRLPLRLRRPRAGHFAGGAAGAHRPSPPRSGRTPGHSPPRPPPRQWPAAGKLDEVVGGAQADGPGGPGGALQEHPARLLGGSRSCWRPGPTGGARW